MKILEDWCRSLRNCQIHDTGDKKLDGALYCSCCGRIHGRCFEAMYPFLYMDAKYPDQGWGVAAEALFDWADINLSNGAGGFFNDIDSLWTGTTVFNAIMLQDCLEFYKDRLPLSFQNRIEKRLIEAADYLCSYNQLINNNVNYPVSAALALYKCYKYFDREVYFDAYRYFLSITDDLFTENGLIYGEGVPRQKISEKGCKSVDIGYNLEESLQSLALLAYVSKDEELEEKVLYGLDSCLMFILENGMVDNSFGTRNYKWTVWGSRTSDGMIQALLLEGKHNPEFLDAAAGNFDLIESCTSNGLLYGGPHYEDMGQAACLHHTFEKAKAFVGVLDLGMVSLLDDSNGLCRHRDRLSGFIYYPEIDTWLFGCDGLTATVTAYDWEYIAGGHVSGGTLSMLFHPDAGVLVASSMGNYSLKEKNNMQVPKGKLFHESLNLRVDKWVDGVCYSSIHDFSANVSVSGNRLTAEGFLKNMFHEQTANPCKYSFCYEFSRFGVRINAAFDGGILIIPLVSRKDEEIVIGSDDKSLVIKKEKVDIEVILSYGEMRLAYGLRRIFNLIPGLEALRIDIIPENGQADLIIKIKNKEENL